MLLSMLPVHWLSPYVSAVASSYCVSEQAGLSFIAGVCPYSTSFNIFSYASPNQTEGDHFSSSPFTVFCSHILSQHELPFPLWSLMGKHISCMQTLPWIVIIHLSFLTGSWCFTSFHGGPHWPALAALYNLLKALHFLFHNYFGNKDHSKITHNK